MHAAQEHDLTVRNLELELREQLQERVAALKLKMSYAANEALGAGVPNKPLRFAMHKSDYNSFVKLLAMSKDAFASTRGARLLWYGDAGDEWRVSKDGRVAALVVLDGVRHLVQYDTHTQAWEYAEQRDDLALYPTDEDPESIPQAVKDAVLTKLKECPKLPNATLGEWDALVAADPGAGSLGDALKS